MKIKGCILFPCWRRNDGRYTVNKYPTNGIVQQPTDVRSSSLGTTSRPSPPNAPLPLVETNRQNTETLSGEIETSIPLESSTTTPVLPSPIPITTYSEKTNEQDEVRLFPSEPDSSRNAVEENSESVVIATEEEETDEDPETLKKDYIKADDNEDDGKLQERRGGIRAEHITIDTNQELVKHDKNADEQLSIKNAIAANDFLRNVLKGDCVQKLVDAMYPRKVKAEEVIIKQGEKGMHLFISAGGTYEVIINGKTNNIFSDKRVFGELALLYNDKRLATIKALLDGRLWVLDRLIYQQILQQTAIKEQEEFLSFLKNVPTLNSATESRLQQAANLLKCDFFKPNSTIVRQGEKGDKFYVIRAGTVTVSTEKDGKVATLVRGQYFGEKALLKEEFRQATVTADPPGTECLYLDRADFVEHFGDIEQFNVDSQQQVTQQQPEEKMSEYHDINLYDLKVIQTLGVGGFGRVELVQHKKQKELTFALKYLKKIDMKQQQQTEHVFNEKEIQMRCNSLFIVRLYKTYKDSKYLYFLMESCMGGDLWTLLQKQKGRCFEESGARFLAACVLEALDYLHKQDYIYRDLKPENMMLDADGYVKLTDFGFAKKLGERGKTFTFAGTPEYVAPEIVLNRGHDRAVDYWAFGIFVYELLLGKTPFKTDDPSHMRTYNLILSGFNNINFPNKVPRSAQHLIKNLCKSKPTDRLGCRRNGAQDIRNHKWFQGFDWEKLNKKKLKSPYVPKLKGPMDLQNFETFGKDNDTPQEDLSNWDEGFDM